MDGSKSMTSTAVVVPSFPSVRESIVIDMSSNRIPMDCKPHGGSGRRIMTDSMSGERESQAWPDFWTKINEDMQTVRESIVIDMIF